MTVPSTPQSKLAKALAWATSRQGMHDIGAVLGGLATIYTALHKAGV